ncbi:hypothetical protein LX64_02585 [Chitinophaga skermanii]|uniref:Uncharacterized protein n=1 Tax=Chitinophaga skermanii TaxID=331697 RepID=A0A327QUL7_9BACT|nr:hypothetical protein [Chitinophaga skermanii]RAJ05427.1 hypothetical protein LX64_02585 [Chitinophaga skermanii]
MKKVFNVEKSIKYYYIVMSVILSLIILLFIFGLITFGQGIGDLFYIALVIILYIFFAIAKNIILRKTQSLIFRYVFLILMVLSTIYFLLRVSILRGVEYPWNGHILYENKVE